ncbi:MAG: hypothetical protein ABSH28_05175 [Acidobacteriota bacterium]|jgi:hypothetical protein
MKPKSKLRKAMKLAKQVPDFEMAMLRMGFGFMVIRGKRRWIQALPINWNRLTAGKKAA